MSERKKESREKWLEEGYRQFALYGPDQLSINSISKAIESSRASFYHFFGDIDIFIDKLLAIHWKASDEFNALGKQQCKALFPDLYELLVQYPIPLQFSLQLFHHRHYPRFNYIYIKTYEVSAHAFALKLFADHLDLDADDKAVYNLWYTLGEAWYSRLDPNDLSVETLQHHSKEIIKSVSKFLSSELYATLQSSPLV